MYSKIKEMDKKAYGGFLNRLSILAEGDLQHIFYETDFNIDYAIRNNEAVIFSLDSLAYQEQSAYSLTSLTCSQAMKSWT